MVFFGICCNAKIVTKSWKFCPKCGGQLNDGKPVPKVKKGQKKLPSRPTKTVPKGGFRGGSAARKAGLNVCPLEDCDVRHLPGSAVFTKHLNIAASRKRPGLPQADGTILYDY